MNVIGSIETGVVAEQTLNLADRLAQGIVPKMQPVFADIHDEILDTADHNSRVAGPRIHAELIARYCIAQSDTIAALNAAEQQFRMRLVNAIDETETRAAILDFARALGADRKQLQSDRKAFEKWFDADAAIERFHKRAGERERALAHAVERLGAVAAEAVEADPMMVDSAFFVELFDDVLAHMRLWPGDARVRRASHLCLASIAERIDHWPFGVWFETVLSATRRVCFDEREDVWVQCAAFDALLALSPGSIATAIEARLREPISAKQPSIADSEIFLRRHLVRLLARNLDRDEDFPSLFWRLVCDEAGVVRQAVADVAHLLPAALAGECIAAMRTDEDAQVRASIFADVPRMLMVIPPEDYAYHIAHALRCDDDEFVLRIALDAAGRFGFWCHQHEAGLDHVIEQLAHAIGVFQDRQQSPKLRRWADEAAERVWMASDRDAMELAALLRSVTHDQLEAEIRPVKALADWLPESREKVGRVMAVLAQKDFGLSLRAGRRPSIQRGEWIKRRLWRILFEGQYSATDKRQAHVHTTGRHYHGTMLAPSARMAELAPTKVPGEPLMESSEGGWRNYLPLIDQVLSALDIGQRIEIFTSAGVTEIVPPSGIWRRARAFWSISRGFAKLADSRNRDPAEFLAALRRHGVRVTLRAYTGARAPNPAIARFFSQGVAA